MGWRFAQFGAGHGAFATADLLEDLVAAGIGQCTGDQGKLPVRQPNSLGGFHRSNSGSRIVISG